MFRLNRNKQKTTRNSWIESIVWYFYENLGLFRNSYVCFEICSKHQKKPKFLVFGFTKQTETNSKQTRNRSCFGLFRFKPKFFLVSRTPYLHLRCRFRIQGQGAQPLSQLLYRQRVIFLVAGSSLVTLFFYAQAGQGFAGGYNEMSSIFADQQRLRNTSPNAGGGRELRGLSQ